MYSIRAIEAVLLGGSGGLRGKYITTQTKQNAAIPRSETDINTLNMHASDNMHAYKSDHDNFVHVAYAEKPHLNVHTDVSS